MSDKHSISFVEEMLKKRDLRLIEGEVYSSCNKKLSLIDSIGYKYYISFGTYLSGIKSGFYNISKFFNNNIYTEDNIRLWIELNNKPYTMLSSLILRASSKTIFLKCATCGREWATRWNDMQNGKGCIECARIFAGLQRRIPIETVIDVFSEIDATIVDINSYTTTEEKVLVSCNKCGYEWQTNYHHAQRGQSCLKCRGSHGERKIHRYLQSIGVKYIPQKRFEGCVYKKPLPFDFYFPEYNACVEYNGEQHYRPFKHFGGEKDFLETKLRDSIKKDFCKNNDIDLYIIPYWEYENIDILMSDILTKYDKNIKIEKRRK